MEEKKKRLVSQLLAHFNNDKLRVKRVGDACKLLGFSLSEEQNLDAIAEHPEAFATIISMADLGIIGKLEEVLNILKRKK